MLLGRRDSGFETWHSLGAWNSFGAEEFCYCCGGLGFELRFGLWLELRFGLELELRFGLGFELRFGLGFEFKPVAKGESSFGFVRDLDECRLGAGKPVGGWLSRFVNSLAFHFTNFGREDLGVQIRTIEQADCAHNHRRQGRCKMRRVFFGIWFWHQLVTRVKGGQVGAGDSLLKLLASYSSNSRRSATST